MHRAHDAVIISSLFTENSFTNTSERYINTYIDTFFIQFLLRFERAIYSAHVPFENLDEKFVTQYNLLKRQRRNLH